MALGDLNNNGTPDWQEIAEAAGKGYEYFTGGGFKEDAAAVADNAFATAEGWKNQVSKAATGIKDTYIRGMEQQAAYNNVSKMATGGSSVGIGEMTMGISSAGMEEYKEALKAHLLTSSIDKINETSSLESAINSGWQGASRDVFMERFNQMRASIAADLTKEFHDLSFRLEELEEDYFAQDNKMIDII